MKTTLSTCALAVAALLATHAFAGDSPRSRLSTAPATS